MESVGSAPLLIIDDFGMRKLPPTAVKRLLEISGSPLSLAGCQVAIIGRFWDDPRESFEPFGLLTLALLVLGVRESKI